MAISFIAGDLFKDQSANYLMHGCNCKGAMGSGIAVQFKKEYPKMYQKYRELCSAGQFKPGGVLAWYSKDKPSVLNLATQDFPGANAKLEYVEECFNKIVHNQDKLKITHLAMPRIGAGIGGLDWDDVKDLIVKYFSNVSFDVTVYEHWQP